MTTYEFYLNHDGIVCSLCEENNLLLEGKEAIELLEKLNPSQIKQFRITSRNIQYQVNDQMVVLVNYKELATTKISLFDEIFDTIRTAIRKKQMEKHKKQVRNRVIAGSAIVSTIGVLAYTSLFTSAHGKHYEDFTPQGITMELPTGFISKEIENPMQVEMLFHPEIPSIQDSFSTQVTYLDFEDARYSITGEHTYSNYYDLIAPYAEKWGLPVNLVMGVFTQESAGNDANLMQIEFDAWCNDKQGVPIPYVVYNFEENKYQKFVLTDHPENYESDIICITRQDLENPSTNVSVGCILLRKSLSYMNYHIGAGIQCYNFGYGNMQNVLDHTAQFTGISKEDILKDQNNLDFMNYTNIIEVGDSDYLKHVMRYVENLEDGLNIQYINANGEIDELHVTILPSGKQL